MENLKERVDNSANFYNNGFLNVDYQLAEFGFNAIKPFFKGNLALELGPASGFMTKLLVQEFDTLHLVEGSRNLIDQIPEYKNVVKHHSLFENFEIELQFDTIIMSHVLEHISDPIFVLSKIKKWLKNDGVLLVAVPNAKSIHRLVAVEMGLLSSPYELNERDALLGHYRVYDTEQLTKDLQQSGFSVIKTGGYFLKPLSNAQIQNYWTMEMIEGFNKVGKHFPDSCAEIFAVSTK